MKNRRLALFGLLVAAAAIAAGLFAALGSGSTPTPITAARYSLVVDGAEVASFDRLFGLQVAVQQADYWETSGNDVHVSKQPGKILPPTVTLRRPATTSLALWNWYDQVRTGQAGAARRNATLNVYNADGNVVSRYYLSNVWPSSINITGTQTLYETVTFTAEYIQRISP